MKLSIEITSLENKQVFTLSEETTSRIASVEATSTDAFGGDVTIVTKSQDMEAWEYQAVLDELSIECAARSIDVVELFKVSKDFKCGIVIQEASFKISMVEDVDLVEEHKPAPTKVEILPGNDMDNATVITETGKKIAIAYSFCENKSRGSKTKEMWYYFRVKELCDVLGIPTGSLVIKKETKDGVVIDYCDLPEEFKNAASIALECM